MNNERSLSKPVFKLTQRTLLCSFNLICRCTRKILSLKGRLTENIQSFQGAFIL